MHPTSTHSQPGERVLLPVGFETSTPARGPAYCRIAGGKQQSPIQTRVDCLLGARGTGPPVDAAAIGRATDNAYAGSGSEDLLATVIVVLSAPALKAGSHSNDFSPWTRYAGSAGVTRSRRLSTSICGCKRSGASGQGASKRPTLVEAGVRRGVDRAAGIEQSRQRSMTRRRVCRSATRPAVSRTGALAGLAANDPAEARVRADLEHDDALLLGQQKQSSARRTAYDSSRPHHEHPAVALRAIAWVSSLPASHDWIGDEARVRVGAATGGLRFCFRAGCPAPDQRYQRIAIVRGAGAGLVPAPRHAPMTAVVAV